MDLKALGDPLEIAQVDFRVQSISPKGWATILAYKDARVDMDRLDQVVGRGKWQRKHEVIDGNLYCSVGIYNDEIKEWVWVQDVGTPSNTEATKGEASDSFKRACFNLGIGRELYDYPLILVQLEPNEYSVEGGKAKATYDLRIKEWRWHMERDANGKISFLGCKDKKGTLRYSYGKRKENGATS